MKNSNKKNVKRIGEAPAPHGDGTGKDEHYGLIEEWDYHYNMYLLMKTHLEPAQKRSKPSGRKRDS